MNSNYLQLRKLTPCRNAHGEQDSAGVVEEDPADTAPSNSAQIDQQCSINQ